MSDERSSSHAPEAEPQRDVVFEDRFDLRGEKEACLAILDQCAVALAHIPAYLIAKPVRNRRIPQGGSVRRSTGYAFTNFSAVVRPELRAATPGRG